MLVGNLSFQRHTLEQKSGNFFSGAIDSLSDVSTVIINNKLPLTLRHIDPSWLLIKLISSDCILEFLSSFVNN